MNEKPLVKHRGRPSDNPVNETMKALLQESHFTQKEFAQFAGVSIATLQDYLYLKRSPVCEHSKTNFWNPSAKRIAYAFGLTPEELYPIETWEEEMIKSLTWNDLQWRIDQWRKTNTIHCVNSHETSHALFRALMKLRRPYRYAVVHWILNKPQKRPNAKFLIGHGIRMLQHLVAHELRH